MNKFFRFVKSVFAFMLSAVFTLCLTVNAAASESSDAPIKIDIDVSAIMTSVLLFVAIFILLVLICVFVLRHISDVHKRTKRLAKINSDDTAQLYEELNNTKWRDEYPDEAKVPGEIQLEDEYKRPQGSQSAYGGEDRYGNYDFEPGLSPMREYYGYGEERYADSQRNVNPMQDPRTLSYGQANHLGQAPATQIPTQPPTYPLYTQQYPPQPRIYRPDASNVNIHMREEPTVDVRYTPAQEPKTNSEPLFDVMSIPSMTVRSMNVYPGGGRIYTGGYTEPVEDISEPRTYTFEFESPNEPEVAVEAEPIREAPIIEQEIPQTVVFDKTEEIATVTIEKRTPPVGDAEVSVSESDESVVVQLGEDVVDGKLMRSLDDVLDDIGDTAVTELEAPESTSETAELVFRAEDMPGVDTADIDEIFDAVEGEARLLINGKYSRVKYQTSFKSRFIQSQERIQDYYSVIKNVIMSYEGITSEITWTCENFAKGDRTCSKINIKEGMLLLYLTLDPEKYRSSKYHYTYVYDKYAKYKNSKVSMMVKIKSDRALRYALELIVDMMEELNVVRGEVRDIDYRHSYETTEQLINQNLIKIISVDGEAPDAVEEVKTADEPEMPSITEEPVEDVITVSLDELITAELDQIAAEKNEEIVEEPLIVTLDGAELTENKPKQIIHAHAKDVDFLISDEEAVAAITLVEDTELSRGGKMCEINLDSICEKFNDGDTVTLDLLKARGLAPKNAGRVKILARGVMTKTLTVYADRFSLQAVKMIVLAGGKAEQYK